MNDKIVLYSTGQVVKIEAALLAVPLLVSLCFREWLTALSFLVVATVALTLGFALTLFFAPDSRSRGITAKGGMTTVALSWILLSLIGAIPFVLSGDIPHYWDALFETVSGFTTTGASILTGEQVDLLSHGCAFWRSFTHWIGGMGILVFLVTLTSNTPERSIHILRAEMPGPTMDKTVPRLKDYARLLYLIYVVMTAVEVIFLLSGGLPLFDSLVLSFGTAGTGGFSLYGDSLMSVTPYVQWVVAAFMLLFGVNFNLYYLILRRQWRTAWKSAELWTYLGLVLGSTLCIALNVRRLYPSVGETVRQAFFQVSSIITTTGYGTADFDLWPSLSKWILLLLMFVGGCAGSTAGGLKVSRVCILGRAIRREIRRVTRPNTVTSVRFEGKALDDETLYGVFSYFVLNILLFFLVFGALCIEGSIGGFVENFSAAASCFNNVGPGFGRVGPSGSYACYSTVAKMILAVAMLLGRLEIYPILITVMPSNWRKK